MRDLSLKAPGTRLTNEFALFLKDLLDKYPIASQSLEKHYGISGKTIQRHYKDQLSEYKQWEQKSHCEDYLLFPDNIGPYLSIDETAFSQGELYTIVTNKANKGKKGSIVAMIKGTNSEEIIPILLKLSNSKRLMVKEMTLDMAGSMNRIVRTCFPRAQKVIDRFHVQKLVYDAVQAIRIKHRWIAIEEENDGQVCIYDNGDSKKQLLARSRYLLFKAKSKWTFSQCNRAKLLFKEFPDIEKAYILAQKLGFIYENTTVKGIAFTRLAKWFKTIEDSGFKSFDSIRRTFEKHYVNILNFFDNRSTNAAAESFNAKNKDFRRNLRGIRDVKFFLFRLSKIYS